MPDTIGTIDVGGPAFPGTRGSHVTCVRGEACRVADGMTLRDWFAGRTLSAVHAACCPDDDTRYAHLAKCCYLMADAMLAEKERTKCPTP